MKKPLTFLLVMICLQTIAQRPIIVKPTQVPTGKPVINTNSVPVNTAPANPAYKVELTPAQMKEQRKKTEMIEKANEEAKKKQEVIDKILKSKLTKVDLEIVSPSYMNSSNVLYPNRHIKLKNNTETFLDAEVQGKGISRKEVKVKGGISMEYRYDETYSFSPNKEILYEDLFGGIDVNLDLTDGGGLDFYGKIRLRFYFSDGTFPVEYNMGTKGIVLNGIEYPFQSTYGVDLHISEKIPGEKFPEPTIYNFGNYIKAAGKFSPF